MTEFNNERLRGITGGNWGCIIWITISRITVSFFAVRRRCGCWQIVWGAKDFCPNFAQLARKELNTNISSKKRLHFAWICTKSKVLGVRLHPRLLLQWIYGYISVGYPDKRVTLLMRFTLFNALQIFKLTMKLNISSPFLCEQKGHSVHVHSLLRLRNRCAVLHTKCVAKALNVENAWFPSYMQSWFEPHLTGCF